MQIGRGGIQQRRHVTTQRERDETLSAKTDTDHQTIRQLLLVGSDRGLASNQWRSLWVIQRETLVVWYPFCYSVRAEGQG